MNLCNDLFVDLSCNWLVEYRVFQNVLFVE